MGPGAGTAMGGHREKTASISQEERGLRGNQPCTHLDLRLPASSTERKPISVVEPTPSVVLCYGSLS